MWHAATAATASLCVIAVCILEPSAREPLHTKDAKDEERSNWDEEEDRPTLTAPVLQLAH